MNLSPPQTAKKKNSIASTVAEVPNFFSKEERGGGRKQPSLLLPAPQRPRRRPVFSPLPCRLPA